MGECVMPPIGPPPDLPPPPNLPPPYRPPPETPRWVGRVGILGCGCAAVVIVAFLLSFYALCVHR